MDASLSMQDVADRVGLSSTPRGRRIQKLEQSGYIKRRVALLDAEGLNLGVSVERVQNSEKSWLVFPRSWISTA